MYLEKHEYYIKNYKFEGEDEIYDKFVIECSKNNIKLSFGEAAICYAKKDDFTMALKMILAALDMEFSCDLYVIN